MYLLTGSCLQAYSAGGDFVVVPYEGDLEVIPPSPDQRRRALAAVSVRAPWVPVARRAAFVDHVITEGLADLEEERAS